MTLVPAPNSLSIENCGSVRFDQTLGERQAEPGAGVAAAEGAVDLAEGRQRLRKIILGDADPGVRHLDPEMAAGHPRAHAAPGLPAA